MYPTLTELLLTTLGMLCKGRRLAPAASPTYCIGERCNERTLSGAPRSSSVPPRKGCRLGGGRQEATRPCIHANGLQKTWGESMHASRTVRSQAIAPRADPRCRSAIIKTGDRRLRLNDDIAPLMLESSPNKLMQGGARASEARPVSNDWHLCERLTAIDDIYKLMGQDTQLRREMRNARPVRSTQA